MSVTKPSKTVSSIAAQIRPLMTANGDVINAGDNLYESTLEGTGLTLAQVKQTHDHRQAFQAATHLVAGELMQQAMSENSELTQMSFETKIGEDVVSFAATRGTDATTPINFIGAYVATDHNRDIEAVSHVLRTAAKRAATA